MDNSPEIVEAFFVRSGNRVVGPFTRHVLVTMFQRGKLSAYAEVSLNRANWRPLSHLGQEFAGPLEHDTQGATPNFQALARTPPLEAASGAQSPHANAPVASLSLLSSASDETPCFYSIDGQVAGQVPLSYVRELALTGRLSPHDRLWIAGTRDWVEAATVPALQFPSRIDQSMKWGRKSPILLACMGLLVLLLVVGPLLLVFGITKSRSDQAREAAQLAKEAYERQVALEKEEVARLEKVGSDLANREDRLISQRLQMESKLEQVNLQYATITAAGARDERIRGRIDQIEGEIQAVDSKIETLRAEQAANAAEQKAANEQLQDLQREENRLQEEGNRSLEETNRNTERINRNTEKTSEEAKKIRKEEEKQTRALQGK
ncbi:MAG: GYF domain-containing protein [Pirellulaceae bacterium]